MTDSERAEAARIIGWLQGFSHSARLSALAMDEQHSTLVCEDACDEYEEKVDRLWSLVMEERTRAYPRVSGEES